MPAKPHPNRRARRVLGWSLAFFMLGQMALCLTIQRSKPEWVDAEYGRRLQLLRKYLADKPGRPLLLVLGSSRTAMGFRPSALPSWKFDSNEEEIRAQISEDTNHGSLDYSP